jgi:bifunctional UDP-N-acetylglucosamine pyrophosphorylase / glucosamine-1-phosphate N-acetyltransferase
LPEEKMELRPRCYDKVLKLISKGVDIPNPVTLDIGEEVNTDRISPNGVTIYPGCRIYGDKTVISAGARIGYEAPTTIEDCQLGPKVELKGGYFSKSTFLEGANMGLGAHVREGSILEEQANGAHCVGLKQTILFPFVTLGSLINFCDCLMAGGTSRQDHSEVGSSYIHFNFTPDGDKTTPSLIGDVPRGVMLNQRAIFLGGQGGMVGPLRIGYGNVVAAGSILRNDYPGDSKLIIGKTHAAAVMDFIPFAYPNLARIVENNILYLANLSALEQWYVWVRKPFFGGQEFGDLMYKGLLEKLALAKKERLKRLKAMADKASTSTGKDDRSKQTSPFRKEFHANITRVQEIFAHDMADDLIEKRRDDFLSSFEAARGNGKAGYLEIIQGLPAAVSDKGTFWLNGIVDALCMGVAEVMPSSGMFRK